MRPSIILAAAIGLAGAVGGGTATAQVPVDGTIEIDLDAAPDVAAVVDPILLLDGADVTSTYCAPAPADSGALLACTGLPDGTYSIDVTGAPAGVTTSANCIDIVADRKIDPIIDVDGGFWDWTCTVFVGTPAVLLTVNGLDPYSVPAGVTFGIVPADAPSDCVGDEINGSPALRCRGLAPGTYDMSVDGVPDTVIQRGPPFCESLIFAAPDFVYEVGPQAVVTDASWLWWCDVGLVPRAAVGISLDGGADPLPDGLALVVTESDSGTDVSDQCEQTSFTTTFGGSWACQLPTGTYSVAFPALAGAPVRSSCDEFVLPEEQTDTVFCEWTIAASSPPTTVPTTISTPPVLPITGTGSTATAWLAVAALAAGIALVAAARRRGPIG